MNARAVGGGFFGALLLVGCLAFAASDLEPPILLGPGASPSAGGGNLASQCSDGIDNDGDGKIDWFGKDGGGDPSCPTPDWTLGECNEPSCAPNPATAGLRVIADAGVGAWPGAYKAAGAGGCPSGNTLSTSNVTYSYCQFSGRVTVTGTNVTCYGCRFRASGSSEFAILDQGKNFRMVYSLVEPTAGGNPPWAFNSGYQFGIYMWAGTWAPLTIERSTFRGYGNAINVDGSGCGASTPCTIRGALVGFPREHGGQDHTDGVGCTSAGNCRADHLTVTGSVFLGWYVGSAGSANTNALAMQEGDNNTNGYDHLMFTRNYISGWNTSITPEEGPTNNTNNLFVNNWFGTEWAPLNNPVYQWSDNGGSNVWAANKWNVNKNGTWSYPTPSDDGRFWYPGDSKTGAKHSTDYNGNSSVPYPEPACNDGLDNDGDGNVDYPWDSGCTSPWDTAE